MEENLADALALHARARPDHPALLAGAASLSHAALHQRVHELSAALLASGLQAGEVLGICMRDSIEHVLGMWACVRAGLVMLPLDWRWTADEREAVVRHFGAHCVLTEADIPIVAARSLRWEELQLLAERRPAVELPRMSLESPLLISLSSGTTGRPKGPLISHRHFLRRFWTHWINLGLNANSRFVCATPLYFGGGRTFVLSVLFSGGTVILPAARFDPETLAATVRQHQANALFLVPTQLRRLLAATAQTRAAFEPLELLLSSGAPLHANERLAIRARLSSHLHEYYASTEGGGVSLCTPRDLDTHPTSVGRPIYGVDVEIVDDEDQPLPPGQVGQLRYRGPGVADSFVGDPEQTREQFRAGWFYPGDLAERDAQGYLFLRGRSRDVVIRGGINIYPNEVEAVLMQLSTLRECCVFGMADADLGERLACAWVGDADGEPGADALQTHCRSRLAPYKVPQCWFRLEALPRNSAGKVRKDAVREACAGLDGNPQPT